jgi:small subunit ribosomal protein S1
MEENNEPIEAVEKAASEPAGTDVPANEETDPVEDVEDMATLYDQTMQNFREGEVVSGRVIEVGPDYVLVDIGYKSEGAIPVHEFSDPRQLEPGQEFDVFIEEPEDEDGMPVLSKIKADKIKNWTHIQRIYEEDGVIEGRIVRRVKGGLKVDIGIDAFMPASQLTWRPTSNLDAYIGQTMEVKIIKLTKRRRNVVVSRRKLLEEQRADEKGKLLATIEMGQIIPGEVKNITDFGAFVDVGGIDGLLHVTDMSWGRVKHPSQVVSVGDRIEVMVLNFDPRTERISLGLKQKTENPWKAAVSRYPIGSVVRGKVVSMTDYGAFVQLEDGIEGMVHVSEMSWTRRVKHPNEMVALEEEVDVMVLSVDPEAEKIALGLKQTRPNPWREIEQLYPVGSVVKSVVRNLTDYGAFVEIAEGIDALLHVSDMSWTKKVSNPAEVLEKGQEIEVKVLTIDPDNEKIGVGLKQLESDPWQEVVDACPIGSHIEVDIAKLVSFGAFARLGNGIEGLIHVSELSTARVQKPEEVLSVGDTVKAKVISIDPVERKIGLSIREYQRDIDGEARAQYGTSGEGSVSIGEVVGDAVPRSLLSAGTSIAEAADQLMAEMAQSKAASESPPGDEPAAITEPEKPAEEPAAETEPEKPTEEPAAETEPETPSGEPVAETAPEAQVEETSSRNDSTVEVGSVEGTEKEEPSPEQPDSEPSA